MYTIEQIKAGIEFQARQCEEALRCADFSEQHLPQTTSGFRKLASHHSDHAFRWAKLLPDHNGDAA